MKFFNVLAVAFLMAVTLAACVTDGGADGLQTRKSLPIGFEMYGATTVSKADGYPVRSGESATRFEVRSGDCGRSRGGGWDDCSNDRERHEYVTNTMGGEKWIHWSIYLPEDYPNIDPVKTVLGQFHFSKSGPPFLFNNYGGTYNVDNQYKGDGQVQEQVPILSKDELVGKWNDILIHVKWTSSQQGYFVVYVNGETKPRYVWGGPTLRSGDSVYMKYGIYRTYISKYDGPVPTQVVYYDDVSSSSTCDSTKLRFNCGAIMANETAELQARKKRMEEMRAMQGKMGFDSPEEAHNEACKDPKFRAMLPALCPN